METRKTGPRTALPFASALATALEIAADSPSSHNSQPWGVARLVSRAARDAARTLAGAGADRAATEYLILAVDRDRELTALPAHYAEMRVSCGLYWRLLRRALAAQGWELDLEVPARRPLLVALGFPATWTPLRLARFRWTGREAEALDRLRIRARHRQTNRGPYLPDPVPGSLLDELAAGSAEPGARPPTGVAHPVHVRYLRSEFQRNRFAAFVARHGGRDFAHREAWRETHSYLRRDAAQARAAGDGFTLAQLFGPMSSAQHLLRRAALAPATMRVLSRIGYPRLLAGQLAAGVRRTPVIVLLSVAEGQRRRATDLVGAGEWLADFWLAATAAGLAVHPISIVIQHADLRQRMHTEFGVPGRIFFVARLGYPTMRFDRAPRRRPAACVREL
ncbi:nitroreductase family protein [Nocardia sp. 2]|uniref:Nitroreductase family protein n=1 Tax=Nocardia acididurans TaxID=2802282 RepID=A0ABS1M5I7_9NOCA|nr:nitroreductase family protein [Nocardia acididurans]MBL1075892.1 nitroreductase family protein [Nocardia acididurans]